MGKVVPFPPGRREWHPRQAEADLLRKVIAESRASSTSDDIDKIVKRLDDRIGRAASAIGWGGVKQVCEKIWPGHGNPSKERRELRQTKKLTTLLDYVERIARATDATYNDVLLEAFRDTSFERQVAARWRHEDIGPELESFWFVLSETLHALATTVIRQEGMKEHAERLVALHGNYELALQTIRPSSDRFLGQPLANWNEHVDQFPPVPSVALFAEPKSDTVDRWLTYRDTGKVVPVRMTVLREVRLAIGPADDVLVPAPLFEFRSVLQLVGPDGPLRIRRPWLYLNEDEVEVEVEGAWRMADIPFDGGDPDAMPEGYDAELLASGVKHWKFPANLEAPLQFEHSYVVWRPVTAGTCRDLLLRPRHEVALAVPAPDSWNEGPETFLPPGTLAEAIEAALYLGGPESLTGRLRAEAARMAALLQGWRVEREGTMEAAHRALRERWEGQS